MNKIKLFNFMIVLLLLWPTYIAFKIGNFPGISLDRLIIPWLFALFIIYILAHKYTQERLKKEQKIIILLLIMPLWNVVSSLIMADNFLSSFYGSINWFLSGPFLALYVLMAYQKQHDINQLIKSIVYTMIIINLLGLIEVMEKDLLFENYLITSNEYTISALTEKTRDGLYRIRSVFSNPLVYAQILIATIPLFIYLLKIQTKKIIKIFLLLNVGLTYFLLYHTGSRAGLALGLMIPFIFYHFHFYKKNWYKFVFKTVFLVSMPLFFYYLYSYVGESFSYVDNLHELNMRGELDENTLSTLARVLQYKLGMEAIVNSPIIGYGFGEAVKVVAPLKAIDSYYLTILLSTGIVGLVIFLYFLYVILNQGFKNIRRYNDIPSFYLLTSFIVILMYYMILSIDKANNLLFLIAAMIFVRAKLQKIEHQRI